MRTGKPLSYIGFNNELDGELIAAVDLGSNSFRLIVARFVDGALQPLVKDKKSVRLADGLDAKMMLSTEAMTRAIEVLQRFAISLGDVAPDRIRVVGTYALRYAKNRKKFLRLANKVFPHPIDIISGDEEARLIYQGVAHTTQFEGRRLIVDIGGGSTEFAIGELFEPIQLSSLPMGCVSFTARYFASGQLNRSSFQVAEMAARGLIAQIDQRFRRTGWTTAIATSGTAKAILAYALHHRKEFSGTEISLELLRWMKDHLLEIGSIDKMEGVEETRKAVLPGGLAILLAVFEDMTIRSMNFSDSALREGVLYELGQRLNHEDIRERTIFSLMRRYTVDEGQVQRVHKTARSLLEKLQSHIPLRQRIPFDQLLGWSIQLHEVGLQINRRSLQMHSAYIIENTEMPGFSEEEQKILAVTLRNYRKRVNWSSLPELQSLSPKSFLILIILVRISILLNIRRVDDYLPKIHAGHSKHTINLVFPEGWLDANPLVRADLETEKAILAGNAIELSFS
jgi:exopolyphosphatase/guanosine-5'-triphosphate,3'-diphosphate pyrophosphatase